ncbi:hypothetical protein HanRHA438_Chr04g0193411 [Helianthus annuus]|nr:hypothetical protein HanRHA438_Chr04g0193411 [Helianthus annuus]
MVRIRHFEFLCRPMHIEPTVNRFRVFYQMHCSQVFTLLPNVLLQRRFFRTLRSRFMIGSQNSLLSEPELFR